MKRLSIIVAVLALSASAHAGFKILTMEGVVAAVLNSKELAAEKESNRYLSSLQLRSIDIDGEKGLTNVYLTYSSDGKAPCTVKAEVRSINTVPRGAAGVNMVAHIESIQSVCASFRR